LFAEETNNQVLLDEIKKPQMRTIRLTLRRQLTSTESRSMTCRSIPRSFSSRSSYSSSCIFPRRLSSAIATTYTMSTTMAVPAYIRRIFPSAQHNSTNQHSTRKGNI
jgi:hypothetical protein